MRSKSGHISQPNPASNQASRGPGGSADQRLEAVEVPGGAAEVLTLWMLEYTPQGLQVRRVRRMVRPKGASGPLMFVA